MINKLTLTDLKQIYRDFITTDFPLMERRPWFSVERAWERGEYAAYGYEDGERFLAYATFYSRREAALVLMDYFAVVPDLRGQGFGSSFLKELWTVIPAAGGILVEAEREDRQAEEAEKSIQRRRLDFYQNNGAVLTGVGCHLFGVDYQILLFPGKGKKEAGEDFFETVCRLYRELYRPVYGTLCRPYRDDGQG